MRKNLLLLATASTSFLLCNAASAQPAISSIATKMTGVAGDLAKAETGSPVQERQVEILNDLDELIPALEKQCQACRNGIKRNNPNRGMPDSMISRGTGGVGPLVDPGASNKDWAKLS